MLINDSRIIWNLLNGVICVYKPAGVTSNQIRKNLITNISKGKILTLHVYYHLYQGYKQK